MFPYSMLCVGYVVFRVYMSILCNVNAFAGMWAQWGRRWVCVGMSSMGGTEGVEEKRVINKMDR